MSKIQNQYRMNEEWHVLWVEDEKDYRKQYGDTFGKKIEIRFAQNLEEAKKHFTDGAIFYTHIIVDLHLDNNNREDGLNLIHWIRQRNLLVPIIAVTGTDEIESLKKAKNDYDADHYIRKIDIIDDFIPALKRLVRRPNLFISYRDQDHSKVSFILSHLYSILPKSAIKIDKKDFDHNSTRSNIINNLQESDICMICFSVHAVDSKWVELEIDTAVTEKMNNRNMEIISINLDGCSVPTDRKATYVVDFSSAFNDILSEVLNQYEPEKVRYFLHGKRANQILSNPLNEMTLKIKKAVDKSREQ